MSKRNREKRQKKVANIDVATRIHQMLRTDFHCTEEEINMIDHALKGMAPQEITDQVNAIMEGTAPLPPERGFHLEMEDGKVESFQMTNHPLNQFHYYLTCKYPPHFAHVYWSAFNYAYKPDKYYEYLQDVKNDTVYMDHVNGNEAEL